MAWHGGSEYAHSSHFRPLDRNDRARWRTLATAAHSRRLITAADHDVALALTWHHGPDGRCDPSHETLAKAARCCARTVARALARLRACGLVQWTRRLVRTRAGAKQTSSAFRLTLANLASAAQRLATRPDRQKGNGTLPMKEKKDLPPNATAEELGIDHAEAAETLRQVRQQRAGIVNPPRPAPQKAAKSLAERRASVLADMIARQRAAIRK